MVGLPLLGAGALLSLGLLTDCRRKEPPAAPPRTPARFEPAASEHLDVAVGEQITERIVLQAEPPLDLRQVVLTSSCDCLSAAFVEPPTATRGDVEVTVHGVTIEDVDGEITAEGPQREELARFVTRISIRRRPFVAPREVVLAKGSEGPFELVLGQAFAPGAPLPASILGELDPGKLDDSKLVLLAFDDLPRETTDDHVILRVRLQFMVVDEARAQPFETGIPVVFGEPPAAREVKVRWPGK